MAQSPPVVLTIAGFDPSSGAGVTADVKTIAAHGCYGVGCITALTVQSTAGVRRVETVNPELIAETLQELSADLEISAVHIGMLGSGEGRAGGQRFSGEVGAEQCCSRSHHQIVIGLRSDRCSRTAPSDRTPAATGHSHYTQCGRSGCPDRAYGHEPGADAPGGHPAA